MYIASHADLVCDLAYLYDTTSRYKLQSGKKGWQVDEKVYKMAASTIVMNNNKQK